MEYKICDKTKEMLDYFAKFHSVEPQLFFEQLILNEMSLLISDAKFRCPERKYNFFEDNGYPCDFNETIDDYCHELQEVRRIRSEKYGEHLMDQAIPAPWTHVHQVAEAYLEERAI